MRKFRRIVNLYWLPSLFIGLGLLISIVSLKLGNQIIIQHPNLFGLILLLSCFVATEGSRHRNLRLFFSFIGLFLAAFRVWWFFQNEGGDSIVATLSQNPLTHDFTILPLNYAIGAIAFFLFQIFEEIYDSTRRRRIWTGLFCILLFSYISIGSLRFFFSGSEGFYLYSMGRILPYDALCLQLFSAYFIWKSWLIYFRRWKLFKISLTVSALGGVVIAVVVTGIEFQIYQNIQNQMERKFVDIQTALKSDTDERLSLISIFGDFLNNVPNPTETQIYAMMKKLNSSGMEAPAVLFFNHKFELKWVYRDNKFLWGAQAQEEISNRSPQITQFLKTTAGPRKFLAQDSPRGHSISFSSPLYKNKVLAGYLVFEDLIKPRVQIFFSKNDFGLYSIFVTAADGNSLLNNKPPSNSVVHFKAQLKFLGENLQITLIPKRALALNSVFIPQFSLVVIGFFIVFFLVHIVYDNRKRVLDVEKEVQDRIRDMKALKEEADRAKMIAEHASYSKSQFLANMSHEIRTPLNVLLGASELLAETELNNDQKKYVDMFQTSGKHLLGLLNDIIDLSRIESGQLETEKISFDLVKTLDFVKKLFSLKAQEQGLQFEVITKLISGPIRCGDPLRIRQILVNLIGNSFKFTQHGTVRLVVSELESDSIQFVVEDSGSGIPDEKQKEIFETFQQGDVSFSRKHGGAGLGLAITKNLCKLMGGNIELISKLGAGSKFIVQIPLPQTTETPVKVDEQDLAEFPESKPEFLKETGTTIKKVLLVDDSDDNRFLVKLFLENSYFQVTEARNGEEAVEFVKKRPFDIILMDMQMPVMDGYEAVKIIRHHEEIQGETTKVPILALTAHGTSLEKNRCLEIGCTDYLSKPVSKNTLIHRISELTLDQAAV
jgi:signal transduction histidine kinase/CheY-like chemotaxis protein